MKNNKSSFRKIDSSDNLRKCYLEQHDIYRNKSESPEPFRYNNYYLPNFNYINNINNLSYDNNSNNIIMFNHNHPININNINNNNLNIMNTMNNMNTVNNMNSMNNDINNSNFINNCHHNRNNNLNSNYNFPNKNNNNVNNSLEDIYSNSKKRGDSFNSCQSLRGNHLSFNSTTDTNNNNLNYINNNLNIYNLLLKNNENQNLLSMQKLFLNLNPYTASLMRNNNVNNHIQYNNNSYFNNQNFGNNNLNNFKLMPTFNNTMNNQPKKSHSTKGFHNFNGNLGFNTNFNNIIVGNMSHDNLSYSSIGSNKAQIKKKRTSLFQNGCNKEKDLRDFKRFCEGLKNPMPEYICSQIGSRIMQKYLKRFPSYIRTLLINKISIYFKKLMCDTYGNYFCQKLYNISELSQRIIILNSLKDCFIKISKNTCGAHVSQFIIGEAQSKEEKKIIIEYISSHELELAFDPEGTHVLQKIITCFPENERQNLNNILLIPENLNALCQDSKGIGVMKKLILNTINKNNRMNIINGLNKNCIEISQNPFGNYIIQYIFEEWDINISYTLIKNCVNNSLTFATQKYSSNVISKIIDLFLNVNNSDYKFIEEIKNIIFDEKNIIDLYNNKYGRLLLSKLSKLMVNEEKEKLIQIFKGINNNDDIKNKKIIDILTELFS